MMGEHVTMQDAKEMVRRCVEIRYYKRKLWMWLMVFLTLTLCVEVMFFTQDLLSDKITQRLMIGVALFLFLYYFPFAIYDIVQILKIKQHPDQYIFREVRFDQPHSGILGRLYFTFTIEDEGTKHRVDTRAIFAASLLGYPNFEDFIHKRVLIGYNKKTTELITIRPL